MAYLENLMEHIIGTIFLQAAAAAIFYKLAGWTGLISSLLGSSVFWMFLK